MTHAPEQEEHNPVKRFTSYEEFIKEFYPKSAEDEPSKQTEEEDVDFGTELALDSLRRHAATLQFRNA